MGAQVLKSVKGRQYLYYVYYDENKRNEIYCGLSTDPVSQQKAKDAELKELQSIKEKVTVRIKELKEG